VSLQYADPAVSLAKFDEEVAAYAQVQRDYQARGWFLVEAVFPDIFVVLASPATRPAPLVCGVHLDYTNYDAAPPSVRLADPFTRQPYRFKDLPTHLNRLIPGQAAPLPGMPGGNFQFQSIQPLMQAHDPDDIPFLCLAGVREYHDHPGHSGDSWELHRATGAGRLVRLLDVISRYGVEPIVGFGVQPQWLVTLQFGEPPQ
jgi:hypothetical protein